MLLLQLDVHRRFSRILHEQLFQFAPLIPENLFVPEEDPEGMVRRCKPAFHLCRRADLLCDQLSLVLGNGRPSADEEYFALLQFPAVFFEHLRKDQNLQLSEKVLNSHEGHIIALLCHLMVNLFHHAGHNAWLLIPERNFTRFLVRPEPQTLCNLDSVHQPPHLVQWMTADVEAQHILFAGDQYILFKFIHIRRRNREFLAPGFAQIVHDAELAGFRPFSLGRRRIQDYRAEEHHLLPVQTKAVKSPRKDHALDSAFIGLLRRHPGTIIHHVPEWAVFLPLLQDGIHHRIPYGTDGGKAVADRIPGHGKSAPAGIDIRRKHLNSHAANRIQILQKLNGIVTHRGEKSCHEVQRIVAAEPCRFIGHHCIRCGMGLVEGIAGEVRHLIKEAVCHLLGNAICHTTWHHHRILLRGGLSMDKILPLLCHDRGLLFGHGTAYQIRPSHRIPGQAHNDLHNLLLIDDASVGRRKDGLQFRRQIFHLFPGIFPLDILRNEIHGARPVKGNSGDHILYILRPELLHKALHAGRLQLEHAVAFSLRDHVKDLRVVHFHMVKVNFETCSLFNTLHRILDHGQGTEAQKVHLQKSQLLDGGHVILGSHRIAVPAERHEILDGFPADHHAGRMHGSMPGQTLEPPGHIDQIPDLLVFLIEFPEIRTDLQRLIYGNPQIRGDGFSHHVAGLIGQIQRPSHITDNVPCSHGTKGDDLYHLILAVFFRNVINDLLPSLIGEVNVNIRHGHALRIEEALKDQLIPDGIDIGDTKGIGNDTSGRRSAPGSHTDAMASGIANEIPDDQKVIHIAHVPDHGKLMIQPVPKLLRNGLIPFFHALAAKLFQIFICRQSIRHIIPGNLLLSERDLHIAALGDPMSIFQRLRRIRKQSTHFLFGFEVELPALVAHPVLIRHLGRCLNAKEDIMRLPVFFVNIVGIIGDHHGDARFLRDPHDSRIHHAVIAVAMVLHLQEVISLPENSQMIQRRPLGVIIKMPPEIKRHLSLKAGGKTDDPLMILFQHLPVYSGLIVIALGKAPRHDARKVGVALIILRQEDQMIIPFILLPGFPVKTAARRNINLAADNGPDALFPALLIKIDGAIHDAMIGNGQGIKAQLLRPAYQLGDPRRTIQQTVTRMNM